MKVRTLSLVLAWFFLVRTYATMGSPAYTVIGPFDDQPTCLTAQQKINKLDTVVLPCWEHIGPGYNL